MTQETQQIGDRVQGMFLSLISTRQTHSEDVVWINFGDVCFTSSNAVFWAAVCIGMGASYKKKSFG